MLWLASLCKWWKDRSSNRIFQSVVDRNSLCWLIFSSIMNNLLLHWSCYVLLIIMSSAAIAQIDQGVLCFWILQVALHSVIPSPCCDARYIISFLFMHNCTYATCIFPCIILSSAYICKPRLPPWLHMWVAKTRIIFGSVLFQMQRLFIRLCSASLFLSHPKRSWGTKQCETNSNLVLGFACPPGCYN